MWTFYKVAQEVYEDALRCRLSWWVRIWSTWRVLWGPSLLHSSAACLSVNVKCTFMLCHLIMKSSWVGTKVCRFITPGVRMCSSYCMFIPKDGRVGSEPLQPSVKSVKPSMSPPKPPHSLQRAEGRSGVPSRYFWSGHRCIFVQQPTDVRLKAARGGADLRDRAGIEPALEWQLDPVGCHIWACWRRECWDVALSCSETLALLSPGCLGRSHCGNLE